MEERIHTLGDVADRLGVSTDTLRRMAQEHELYAPDVKGFPGARHGRQIVAYHSEHLKLIVAAAMGALDVDEALTRWELYQAKSANELLGDVA